MTKKILKNANQQLPQLLKLKKPMLQRPVLMPKMLLIRTLLTSQSTTPGLKLTMLGDLIMTKRPGLLMKSLLLILLPLLKLLVLNLMMMPTRELQLLKMLLLNLNISQKKPIKLALQLMKQSKNARFLLMMSQLLN